MLNIDVENAAGVTTVHCNGRLLRGEAVRALSNTVVSAKNTQIILLDLSEVEALDACGLNALVALHGWASLRGVNIKLVDPSKFVRDMMVRFHLDRIFQISSFADTVLILAGRGCSQLAPAC
jgi:anti-anti-sigma factor